MPSLLLLIFLWYNHIFIYMLAKSSYFVQNEILMTSITVQCRGIHTWYDNSILEKWEHGIQGRGVQAWDDMRLGTD